MTKVLCKGCADRVNKHAETLKLLGRSNHVTKICTVVDHGNGLLSVLVPDGVTNDQATDFLYHAYMTLRMGQELKPQ